MLSDELTYELQLRRQRIPGTVMAKRSLLRRILSADLPLQQPTSLDPAQELDICQDKLTDLVEAIQHFNYENAYNEMSRTYTRLRHVQGRLDFIKTNTEEQVQLVEQLKEAANRGMNVLKGLDTANHRKSSSQGRLKNRSLLDTAVPLSPGMSLIQPEGASRVEESLIVLEDELVHPLLPMEPERKPDLEDLLSQSRRICDTLLEELPTAPMVNRQREPTEDEEGVTNRWTSSVRRVSFPDMQKTFTYRKPEIEKPQIPSETGDRTMQPPTVPIHKWNLSFDGTGSVTEFIEEVERLAECRKTSLDQVFDSVYELLRKDVRDWFVPRRGAFQDWEDFKTGLKEAFLPINYEENLLEEIKRRTQGTDEQLLLYVTRMQNLFQKLTENRPSEEEQIRFIRKRLVPSLQQALTFQETSTYDELLRKGKVFELIQWQMGQYTKPPVKTGLIDEPHLTYRPTSQSRYQTNFVMDSSNPDQSAVLQPDLPLENTRKQSTTTWSKPPDPQIPPMNCQGDQRPVITGTREKTERKVTFQTQCFRCGGFGHMRRECRRKPRIFCSR